MQRFTFAGIGLLGASLVVLIIKGISIHPALTKVDFGPAASIGPFISDFNFVEIVACLGVVVGILLILVGLSGAPKGVLGYRP